MNQAAIAPIAVIGLAGIFPQAATVQTYWQQIVAGKDCITEVPPSRWNAADYYHPDPDHPDTTYCKRGGFLPDIDFDPLESGLPPSILEVTDSSQLLALVVAKRLLAEAGYGAERPDTPGKPFDRERVSVILGVTGPQKLITPLTSRLQYPLWRQVLQGSGMAEAEAEQLVTRIKQAHIGWQESAFPGFLGNVVAGRIANRLDLGGTNCVVDAACASSLGALKLAVSELAAHQCDMVLSGGVDTDNSIFMYLAFSKTQALSRQQQCRPFDEQADGTLLGEGIGMVLLKRLEDAQRDGDRIYAVIRGIGSSSDGRHTSIYAPLAAGQVKALERAYASAGIPMASIGLLEAHGTGTAIGDITEFEALRAVLERDSPRKQSIALGSVKAQIGHTKAAAGVASLIKAVLALHHRLLPPTINIERPNARLSLNDSPLYLNTEPRPWLHSAAHPRRAGVSAFGFGGTNFHVVLEEYPTADEAGYYPALPLSAQQQEQEQGPSPAFAGAPYHARGMLPQGGIVALFPGQGAQYVNMGRELAIAAPPFRAVYQAVDEQYAAQGLPPLSATILPAPAFDAEQKRLQEQALQQTAAAQPAIGAFSAGLYGMLRQMGFQPDFVAGHSFGELTALWAAGVFSDADFFCLMQARGQAMTLPPDAAQDAGAMLAVMGDLAAIQRDIAAMEAAAPGLSIVNWNAPDQVVCAGPTTAILHAQRSLHEHGYHVARLPVAAAFHTPLVSHAQQAFDRAIQAVTFQRPTIPVFSNTTGERYPDDPAAIRDLLRQHMLQPVLFQRQIENLYAAGGRLFVECGPRDILTRLVGRILAEHPHAAIALNPEPAGDSLHQFAAAVARLRAAGLPLHENAMSTMHGQHMEHAPREAQHSRSTIRLSASNYVSEKTRHLFEQALQRRTDGQPDMFERKDLPPEQPGAEMAPAAPDSDGTRTFQPHSPAAFERALSRINDYQRDSLRLQEKYLEHEQASTAQLYQLLQQQQAALLNQNGSGPTIQPAVLEMLTQGLHLLHERHTAAHQEQQAALQAQREYTSMALRLIQDYYTRQPASSTALPTPEATPAPPVPPASASSVAPASMQEPEPPQEPPAPAEIARTLLEIVAEKTAYPVDVLGLDMDIAADLGIDSIKFVEILGALRERFPHLPRLSPEELAEVRTLGQIVEHAAQSSPHGSPHGSPGAPVSGQAAPVQGDMPAPNPAISRRVAQLEPLPPPDHLECTLPAGFICLLTDDGTTLTPTLARALAARGWPVVVLRFPPTLVATPLATPQRNGHHIAPAVENVALHDMSEAHLQAVLRSVEERYGRIGAVIHLHPPAALPSGEVTFSEQSGAIVRHIFLIARYAAPALLEAAQHGQGWFYTVTRLDGEFGLSLSQDIDVIQGGLAGITRSVNLEWEPVCCRALDLAPSLVADQAAACILAELFDPNRLIVEVGYSERGRWTLVSAEAETPV